MASVFAPTRAGVKTLDELYQKHNMLIERMDYHASPVINGGGFGDVKSPIVPGVIDSTVVLYDGISGKRIKASTIYANWFDQSVATTASPTFVNLTLTKLGVGVSPDPNIPFKIKSANDSYKLFSFLNSASTEVASLTTTMLTVPNATVGTVVIPSIFNDQIEPTGCYDRTATLEFVDGTRTFSITGNHIIYRSGEKRTMPTASLVISNVSGSHYIYYNSSWALAETTSLTTFSEPYVAVVYWDVALGKGLLADERHGIVMDASTQDYLHNSVGTRYISGFGATFGNTTFTVGAGVIMDEDYRHNIAQHTDCLILYKNGAATFEWEYSTGVYYKSIAGSLQYNNGNTLTPVDSNKYVAMWIFATNVPAYPIFAVVGQRQDTLIADARANNSYEGLSLSDLPFREFKILYRVILRNDATPYEEVLDLRTTSQFGTSAIVLTAHNALTGLDYATAGHTGFLASTAIDDTAYGVDWNGDATHAPTKNAVYDKIETLSSAYVSDEAYGVSWNGVTTVAPSKNAIYDKIETLGTGGDVEVILDKIINGGEGEIEARLAAILDGGVMPPLAHPHALVEEVLTLTNTTAFTPDADYEPATKKYVDDGLGAKQATLTFGIANTNAVQIDADDVADNEYARFTANGLESRSAAEVLSDIGAQASNTTIPNDGWISGETWTYVSAYSFSVGSDVTTKYQLGDKIKLTQATVKFFNVAAVSVYSGGITTITVAGGTDFTLANAEITSPYWSRVEHPLGFPDWFNYTPTWVGFTATVPSSGRNRYRLSGRSCTVIVAPSVNGVSNATNMTATLPFPASAQTYVLDSCFVVDNSNTQASPGIAAITESATAISFYKDWNLSGWTNSGNKRAIAEITYEI